MCVKEFGVPKLYGTYERVVCVCERMVCERVACKGVVCDKVVCESAEPSAISAMPATRNQGGCAQVLPLPRKWNVDVTKRPACHAKCWGTPTTNGDQVRHQTQPSATSSTPGTPNAGRCRQVPCLPRKTKVDVSKSYACHVKCRGAMGD